MSDKTATGGLGRSGTKPASELQVLVTVLSGSMLGPLNGNMLVIALSSIAAGFGQSVATTTWLITAYLVAQASLNTLGGKIGDRFGRRPVMLSALVGFGLLSLAAALAPSFQLLLLFRTAQAFTITLVAPNGMALLREIVPASRRGARFGLMAAGMSLAGAVGPALGGALLDLASWRALFFVNVPVVLVALLLGWRSLPKTVRPARQPRFDLVGAFLLTVILLLAAISMIEVSKGGDHRLIAGGVISAVLFGVAFGFWESRHSDPVLRPQLFLRRGFSSVIASQALNFAVSYSLLLAIPLMLQQRGRFSDLQIGFILTGMSIAVAFVSPFGGRLADRLGRRIPVIVGAAIVIIGLTALNLAGSAITVFMLIGILVLIGIGNGTANPSRSTAALEAVPDNQIGVASGAYNASRNFGGIAASAIIAGVLGGAAITVDAVDTIFLVALAAAVLNFFVSFGIWPRAPKDL